MLNKAPIPRFNFTQYFKNKKVRDTTTFIISPTEAFYEVDGEKIPIKQFEAAYPLTVMCSNPKGENKDGTRIS